MAASAKVYGNPVLMHFSTWACETTAYMVTAVLLKRHQVCLCRVKLSSVHSTESLHVAVLLSS